MTGGDDARSLWRNTDFVTFWSGETVSQFGSQVTLLALPLTAVLTLTASPVQMGVLNAVSYLPFLLLTLFVGVWADRVRRRPIMISSAVGRALVLGSIPLLSAVGVLSIGYLYVAALVLGVFTVLFEVTYQAYLPSLVDSEDLVDGNSKLQVSTSAAQVGGPAIGGWLVHWLTAPTALLVDAVSFVVSAASLIAIRTREAESPRSTERRHVLRDISEGLRFILSNRTLRACVLEAGTYNLFWMVLESMFLLYATRERGMSAGTIGLVLGGGAVGALVGALVVKRLSARLGVGNTVSAAMVVGCAAPVLVPLAGGSSPVVFVVFVLSFFVGGAATTVANIEVVSLRQVMTPQPMLGRMNASYRFVSWGTVPLGSLVGGGLGEAIGLRPTLFVGSAGLFCAALWIVFSPVRSLVQMPTQSTSSETETASPAVS